MIDSIKGGVHITPQKKVFNNNIAFQGRIKKHQTGEILDLKTKKKKEKQSILSKIGNFFTWLGALTIGISGALMLMVMINSKLPEDKKQSAEKQNSEQKRIGNSPKSIDKTPVIEESKAKQDDINPDTLQEEIKNKQNITEISEEKTEASDSKKLIESKLDILEENSGDISADSEEAEN